MSVYSHEQKIGYTHHRLSTDGQGFAFEEESLLRLSVLDTFQTVRTRMRGHAQSDFTLQDIDFELSSGVGNLQATGTVSGAELRLTLRTGTDVSEQVLTLVEPLYLPSTLRALVCARPLRSGQHVEALVFDPTTLKNDRIRVAVESQEAVPGAAPGVRGWRVTEEFRQLKTSAWIDASGAVLREEGPLGLVLVRQTATEAVNEGWTTDTALDLVATVKVPVPVPIADARNRTVLRVRLSGISLEDVPTDDEQMRDGSVLTVTRPELQKLASYELPYRGGNHADDLRATAFLQSDHPRVAAAAREIVGDERDAMRAMIRLNDWVYGTLRKVPTISIPNALQVLEMGEGDCNEHAVLLAALSRAAGIPTRVIAGVVYVDGSFFYHSWCEGWFGQWVSIDPAFDQFPADATHIKFVVGDPDKQLAMMGIIGRLGIEVLDGSDMPHG